MVNSLLYKTRPSNTRNSNPSTWGWSEGETAEETQPRVAAIKWWEHCCPPTSHQSTRQRSNSIETNVGKQEQGDLWFIDSSSHTARWNTSSSYFNETRVTTSCTWLETRHTLIMKIKLFVSPFWNKRLTIEMNQKPDSACRSLPLIPDVGLAISELVYTVSYKTLNRTSCKNWHLRLMMCFHRYIMRILWHLYFTLRYLQCRVQCSLDPRPSFRFYNGSPNRYKSENSAWDRGYSHTCICSYSLTLS